MGTAGGRAGTVRLRPTLGQGFGRGLSFGVALGGGLAVIMLIATFAGLASAVGVPGWLIVLVPVVVGLMVGGVFGAVLGRGEGADVDNCGILRVPGPPGTVLRWENIEDLRTERVGGRTHITVCLDTGAMIRIAAPYDGRLLAADPGFERKLFMVRTLWETNRGFVVRQPQYRAD
jgi:hypothetical protein